MKIPIKEKKGWDKMQTDEQARWLCLMNAVNISATYAEENGIDPNKSYKWIKPYAYNSYIKEMFPSMRLRIQHEKETGIFSKSLAETFD